jgi:NRAMP (natural resistance-associated macrophage protein)-like metal ion transporter
MPVVAARSRHHHHRRRLRGFGYFKRLGPGLVTGAADDDPSGIGTYSQVGAAFGFGLLWTSLFTLPMAAAVQETAARLGLVTGRGLASLIKERFPRWTLFMAVLLVSTANVFNIGADLGSMAESLRLLVPVPFAPLIVLLAAVMVVLEITVTYARYARVLRWLTLSLGAYIAVLFLVSVDWAEVVRSTLIPTMRWSRTELAALIAIFGTTISPYLFFWQASEEVEEELDASSAKPAAVDPGHVKAMRIDVLAGMASAVLVMFAIMVACASTLGARGITTVTTADQAARALRPAAGDFASLLFTLGIVGTGALAVPVLAGSTGYALSEAFGWHEGLSRSFWQARGFYLVISVAVATGVVLDLIRINPIRALYLSAILNGLAAPPLILLMLLLSNSRETLGSWRGGRWSNALVGLPLVLMTGLPIAYLLAR